MKNFNHFAPGVPAATMEKMQELAALIREEVVPDDRAEDLLELNYTAEQFAALNLADCVKALREVL